uniref:Uncharacterized protein n=1 Tax=Bombyx mori TaxID=7091 RepID=A0A8R2R2B5_BOMMO|nr:uncharacterized protein LOC101735933 isoform X2 [Bombyx mori]
MLFKAKTILSTQDLQDKINQLHVNYLPMNLNPSYERLKISAMNKIEQILHESTRKNLQEVDFEELLLCVLTILYFFGMRLKINNLKSRNWNWCLKRNFIRAETVFQDTINNLSPERSEITIKITFKFLSNVDLWQFESFVVQILEVILYYNNGQTTIFNLMLSDIQSTLFSDVKSARHRIRVLYDLLKSENWIIEKQYLLPFVSRLLELFSYSIEKNDLKLSAYGFLRKGFEVCLRRIFERVENHHRIFIITTMLNWFSVVNLNSDHVLEFSSLLDRAAELYTVESYTESFGPVETWIL